MKVLVQIVVFIVVVIAIVLIGRAYRTNNAHADKVYQECCGYGGQNDQS